MPDLSATDWDQYYAKTFPAARILRAITGHRLIHGLQHSLKPGGKLSHIVEFGGGNSCFAERLCRTFHCESYTAADTNERGLELFRAMKLPCRKNAVLQNVLLDFPCPELPDLVFSAGLIEHFSSEDTTQAIRRHFQILKPGGLAAFLFPSDTGLYRITRSLIEFCGAWNFPDERPLLMEDVRSAASGFGTLLHQEMIYPILLTQGLMIFRKAD